MKASTKGCRKTILLYADQAQGMTLQNRRPSHTSKIKWNKFIKGLAVDKLLDDGDFQYISLI